MKLTKKTIIGIVLLIAVAVALWYFVFRKKAGAVDGLDAVDAGDQAAYDAMFNLMSANVGPHDMVWIGDLAKKYYTGESRETDAGRLINGRSTKAGALLSTWATAYYPYDYTFKMDKNQLNGQLYSIFYNYKAQASRL